ncbi:SCAN domain-containing protein 3-like [Gigaspora margarita]|uniref:SCAN domain-containing protein 3-like n=1 Tax=Gigaspora margarita TaxID=4874 RepID=A0A8H4AK72_GIGMA|nr:SCAN domain-containing protein 3-like [Gigaspora margarita]
MKKSNFQRRSKHFMYDQETNYLFFEQSSKNENSPPTRKRVVPTYDFELREALFKKFHHEVKKYVNACPTCIRNGSIKEKFDFVPVVSSGPLEHLQIDLVDLLSYAEHNDRYSYALTLIDVFSRYVWVIPLKDQKGSTIHSELAPHETHKKLPNEVFFEFKMRAVYNTLEEITPEDIALEDIALDDVAMEDITEDTTAEEITPATIKIILTKPRINLRDASKTCT